MKIEKDSIYKVENFLNIISDATRLKILFSLLDKKDGKKSYEKSVGQIVDDVGLSQSLISHQLAILKNGDVVGCRKEGRYCFYYLNDCQVNHLKDLLNIAVEHAEEEHHE